MNFDPKENLIFLTLAGSHAYGVNIETSDEDFRGICVVPKEYLLGPFYKFDQKESISDDEDVVIYSLNKFVKLASECNPNCVELLFINESDWVKIDEFGRKLVENRYLFLTKQAKFRFMGYAHGQLHRIKNHKKWLEKGIKSRPEAKNYDNIEEFQSDCRRWEQYLGNRNEKRRSLEENFGYETKHAMHLIRLMKMCHEILSTGNLTTKRPDAEELKAIRNGSLSYDELLELANKLEKDCELAFATSTLPEKPDIKNLNNLCVEINEEFWKRKQK